MSRDMACGDQQNWQDLRNYRSQQHCREQRVRRACRRWLRWPQRTRQERWNQWEHGSGTIVGIGLILALGVLLSAALALGNVLICKSVARTAADHAALAGATAYYQSGGDACTKARQVADRNHARLKACQRDGDDVTVRAVVSTRVPLVREVTAASRAGPKDCPAY